MQEIFKLIGSIQHYDWGGTHFISELTGNDPSDLPSAEYWMGAHPNASSVLVTSKGYRSLFELIRVDPEKYLGSSIWQSYGQLPFLFKVLDVQKMLSIQVHPSKEAAEQGFIKEEEKGIAVTAAMRNYKDRNHKPELMVALSPFWLLHGFKEPGLLVKQLQSTSELSFLVPVFKQEGYSGLYKKIMQLPQEEVNEILLSLVRREVQMVQNDKSQPGFWVKRLYEGRELPVNLDRGIFSIYFFNILQLQTGEGIFQGAGLPHAYLEGQNIELMSNSDNVLRGGLTSKHIDVAELLKHIHFEPTYPKILKGTIVDGNERIYECPVPDFRLGFITLEKGMTYHHQGHSGEIFFVYNGIIGFDDAALRFKKGEAFYVLPEARVNFRAFEDSQLYRAFVPND